MIRGIDEGYFINKGNKSPIHCLVQTYNAVGKLANMHFHNYIEILYGLEGCAKIWIDEKIYHLQKNDICIINPRKSHYIYTDDINIKYYVIKFSPDLLFLGGKINEELKYILPIIQNDEKLKPILKNTDCKIKKIAEDILEEWESERAGYEFFLRANVIRLFGEIVRLRADNNEIRSFNQYDKNSMIIIASLAYISDNLLEITEEDAAKYANMSYSYFSRCFKNTMNKNFSKYIEELKIDEAKKKLLTEDKSITDIAMELGYSTTSHFISNFKKSTNQTPLAYKKTYKI